MFRRRKKGQEAQPKKSAPDLEGLAKLIREADRGKPVHFAGRGDEIEEIEALAESAREGAEGLTHVITAAPGAGKTALLRELARRLKESGAARPVLLPAGAFADPGEALREMFVALSDPAAERFGAVETEAETQYAEGGMRAGLAVKAGAASGRSVQRATLPRSFSAAFRLLADRETPVVLLVDEAQEWGADQDAADGRRTSSLLMEAHQNLARLPLLIVAAGLDDSREAIAARGVSKRETEKKLPVLGRLDGGEQRDVARAFFERFGVGGSAELRAEWTEALISGTDGWPRHLTNALRGAAKAIIKAEGDLARASLADALDSAKAYREQYYDDQLAPFRGMPEMLAEVLAALPSHPPGKGEAGGWSSEHTIKKAIARAYQNAPDLDEEMPKGEAFKALRHKGLVQDFGKNRYACPIPSFWSYAEAFCAEDGCPVRPAADAPEPAEAGGEAAAPAPGG